MKNDIWEATRTSDLDEPMPSAPPRSPLLDAKVMMVDDEPLMTALIETHLEEAGYTNFVSTNDPREVLGLLRHEQPGVLLLDLMMPGISGFDLLEAIRADRNLRYTPVIVLTASTGADAKLRALQLGATDFLAKPVDASELVLRVRNTLAFHQYTDRMVNFDVVTQLPNERPFDRGIASLLAQSIVEGTDLALLSIEVPDCRLLRESVGQAAADQVARAIARRLTRFAEHENPSAAQGIPWERAPRVARLAADRFGLVLEGASSAHAVESAAKRLARTLSEPVGLGRHDTVPSVWIGIALAPGDGRSAEVLRKSADLAATHARQNGVLPVQFASAELNERSLERVLLGSQLRGAAERGELRVHYQPKVDLRSGRIVGAEALVRWQHADHGLLAPTRFVPLAEEMGLITAVGEWVAEQACRDAADWRRAGLGDLKVAINVTRLQFVTGDLCSVLRQAMFDAGLPPSQLVIELTESMLMDGIDDVLKLMHELKALGVTLSVDDFGTGYSSLSYLKRFPLNELKIDRSFVKDLPGSAADTSIVRTVVELGHSLGMSITAEGVETAEQRACLKDLGCDLFQGFVFSRPVPVEQFVELARNPPRG
jgi:EAL domain-containing protein (putative c-di-GMP-specific phosphodiesterase class I)/PleD family two-component response regulator